MFKMPFRRQNAQKKPLNSPNLSSKRVYLRCPHYADYQQWAELRCKSRIFLQEFEPKWPSDAHTLHRYKTLLDFYSLGRENKDYYVFFIFRKNDNALIGGISLGNIRRSVMQNGQIGYWCGEPYSRQGFMRESLNLVLDFAFKELKLHRLEAASIPINHASIRLLESCGFKKEGLLKDYVKINDVWQDHFLYALIENEWQIKQTDNTRK